MQSGPNGAILTVPRHSAFQRLNHWLTAALFVLLALSGMAMYHPGFFFLSALFGGGTSARDIHPWLGIALAASFFVLAVPMVLRNIWNRDDLHWMLRFWRVATNRHDGLPELGKYNAALRRCARQQRKVQPRCGHQRLRRGQDQGLNHVPNSAAAGVREPGCRPPDRSILKVLQKALGQTFLGWQAQASGGP